MTTELPEAFVARIRALAPDDQVEGILAAYAAPKDPHARLNPLRAPPDAREQLAAVVDLHATPWCPEGFFVPLSQREALLAHPLVEQGAVYLQSPSSWVPVLLLDAQPGEEVLDLAAAPGGKTTHLAARMQNQGRLATVEPIKDRFFRLKGNVDRAGATCVVLYMKDGRDVGRQVPARFDRVLLDAPCSSEARFEAGRPESWAHWSDGKIGETSRKQRGLILSAYDALKPGGRMVYATCSLSPEEDEAVVDHLLRKREDAIVLPARIDGVPLSPGVLAWQRSTYDPRVALTGRLWPNTVFDAFFVALIEKPGR